MDTEHDDDLNPEEFDPVPHNIDETRADNPRALSFSWHMAHAWNELLDALADLEAAQHRAEEALYSAGQWGGWPAKDLAQLLDVTERTIRNRVAAKHDEHFGRYYTKKATR